eukprot:472482-Prymnesium_polylepis.1
MAHQEEYDAQAGASVPLASLSVELCDVRPSARLWTDSAVSGAFPTALMLALDPATAVVMETEQVEPDAEMLLSLIHISEPTRRS